MSLAIYASASVDLLADKLAEKIRENNNIFTPEFIVTPNSGINNWLKTRVAEINDIAANIHFTTTDEMIKIAWAVMSGGQNDSELLDQDVHVWLIYTVLGSEEFKELFEEHANYFKDNELKKFGLAKKLSVQFADYQHHIAEELNGNYNEWQSYIWNKSLEISRDNLKSINYINKELSDLLQYKEKQEMLFAKLPSINLFAGLHYTMHQLEIYEKLSEYIDINFYVQHSAEINNQGDALNELIENFGQMGIGCFELLSSIGEIESLPNVQGYGTTLLSKIQCDVLSNNTELTPFTLNDVKDGSLTINSCYTPTREVEVLYNFLLKTFDESAGSLGARDVMVLTSDIDLYAPAIKGIFGSAPVKFPFSLTDSSYAANDSVFNTLEKILTIEDNFKAEAVMQLVESGFIRNKFQLEDIELIRKVINRANIRYGLDNNVEDETFTVSWRHGMKRILFGICMSGGGYYEQGDEKIGLLDVIEGADALELIRLNAFFEKLVQIIEERNHPKTLAEWCSYINMLITELIVGEDDGEINQLQRAVSKLSLANDPVGELIQFIVFRESVLGIISSISGRSKFGARGITFCNLSMMRSVPFKVVAMLGMNLDSFPRKTSELSFDLLKDRLDIFHPSVKDQDKQMFLQTLMSARDKLYISFIGRDVQKNSGIPPSSAVDVLIDYVSRRITPTGDIELVTEHPLHGFSSKYFVGQDARYYSYLYDQDDVANLQAATQEEEDEMFREINLQSLINFLKNPFQFYYNHTLGIYYGEEEELLGETECFDLDKLQEWSIKNDWTYYDDDLESFREEKLENGGIPLRNYGRVQLEELTNEVGLLKANFVQDKQGSEERKINIKIELNDTALVGQVRNIYGDRLIVNCISKKNRQAKYWLDFYVNVLALVAYGHNSEVIFNGFEGQRLVLTLGDPRIPSREAAIEKLNELVDLYKTGKDKILPFTTEIKWDTLKRIHRETEPDDLPGYLNRIRSGILDFHSPYLALEMKEDFFNDMEVIDELKRNISIVLDELFNLFPIAQ